MNKRNELRVRIEQARAKLDQGLEQGKTFNELYQESLVLDQMIEAYMDFEINETTNIIKVLNYA